MVTPCGLGWRRSGHPSDVDNTVSSEHIVPAGVLAAPSALALHRLELRYPSTTCTSGQRGATARRNPTVGLSEPTRILAAILLFSLVTVETGGLYLMHLLPG
jgi:hypothetical protein